MHRSAFRIGNELKAHVPFTGLGTLTGAAIMLALWFAQVPRGASERLFWTFHPLHVFLSAFVTAAMFCRYARRRPGAVLAVGYLGSVGIATLSDCVIPFAGEWLLDLPNRGLHLGFIQKWWLVNPLALAGIVGGSLWQRTRVFHAGHVLISTWASLFHIMIALGARLDWPTALLIPVFLFLAVWVPCCTSDIVFPLLFVSSSTPRAATFEDLEHQMR